MMKIALIVFFLAFFESNFAAERSHGYEDIKMRLSDGIDNIINQLTDNADHFKDDYEDDFGWDFDDVDADSDINDKQQMSLQYFKLHDYDKNNYLDGTEIMKSMIHEHGDHSSQNRQQVLERINSASDIVDLWLLERDLDKDGLLSFFEFKYSASMKH